MKGGSQLPPLPVSKFGEEEEASFNGQDAQEVGVRGTRYWGVCGGKEGFPGGCM